MSSEPRPRGRPRAFHDKTDQNTVQALDRALGLLSTLAAAPGMTLSELAETSGQAVATVYRALVTLQGHAMVELEEPGQVWHIGPGAFRVGSAFLRRTKVIERARAPMEALMRDSGETANLGVEVGDEVLFYASNAEPSGVTGLARIATGPLAGVSSPAWSASASPRRSRMAAGCARRSRGAT